MKYYKSKAGLIYAFPLDGSQDTFIQSDYISLSESQYQNEMQLQKSQADNALDYKQKRRSEYPDIMDYIDGVVKGDQQQIQKYIDDCLAVKKKYPKT